MQRSWGGHSLCVVSFPFLASNRLSIVQSVEIHQRRQRNSVTDSAASKALPSEPYKISAVQNPDLALLSST